MADEQEPSPRNVGSFLLWMGVILVAALAVFLVVFYLTGHKASLMKNSQLDAPSALDRDCNAIIPRQAFCIHRRPCPRPFVAACRRTRRVRQSPQSGDEKSRWGLIRGTP